MDAALEATARPTPELYLQAAGALEAAGRSAEAAVRLDAGLVRLGPAVSLELAAIDLDVRRGAVDSALARIDAAAGRSRRPERWIARRTQVLESAGRCEEARWH